MARLLFWILFAIIAYAVARSWLRAPSGRGGSPEKPPEAIVRCSVCGLNVPQSEALARADRWYCSREHLERGRDGG
jgi:hypothetical protein